ncbi:MAG: adenylosuccinate synthetase, partial [Anaerolineales bacterium]
MMANEKSGAFIIVGAQWGDEGKGLISAYVSAREKAALVCRSGVGPNAEHGIFLSEDGPYLKVNQLPLGWMLNPQSQIRIGSGVAVNPEILLQEMDRFRLHERVKVDYRSPIITKEHIEAERASKGMKNIGSTFSGSGYCRADFILRTAQQAEDIPELKPFLTDIGREINQIAANEVVIVESSQGTYLSLAVSPDYPNVTSDNTTALAAADDALLNWKRIKEVILAVKTMPTREGAGSLGTEELDEGEMIAKGLVEYSSIGGAVRRKGMGINWEMLAYAAEINGATQVALTFCEHFDPTVKSVTDIEGITEKIWQLIEKVKA